MVVTDPRPKITVPLGGLSRVHFVDEAGTKGSGGALFVGAVVECSDAAAMTRAVQSVRDRYRKGAATPMLPLN